MGQFMGQQAHFWPKKKGLASLQVPLSSGIAGGRYARHPQKAFSSAMSIAMHSARTLFWRGFEAAA